MKSHEELMFKLEITPKKYVISLDNPKPIQAYVKNTSGIEQDVFVTVESFFFRIVNPTAVKHYTTQIYRHMKPNETLIFEIGTWDDATLNLPIEDLAKKYMHLGSIEGCLQVHHSEQWGFPLLVAEVCDDIFPDTYDTINRGWCIIQLVAEHETEFMKKRKADFEEIRAKELAKKAEEEKVRLAEWKKELEEKERKEKEEMEKKKKEKKCPKCIIM